MSTLVLPNNQGVRIAFKTAAHLARTKYDQVANCKDCSLDTKDLYNAVATFFESQHKTLEEMPRHTPIAWHVGGNGYDRLYMHQPDCIPYLGVVNEVYTLEQLLPLLKRYDMRAE